MKLSMLSLWLIVLLISALMTGPVLVVQTILGDGPWLYLIPLLTFVSAETMLTTRWVARPQQRQLSHTQYRIAEFIFLLLIIRFLTWIVGDVNPTTEVWRNYLQEPITFLDRYFVLFTLFTLITWQETIFLTRLWLSLPPSAGEQQAATAAGRSTLSGNDNPWIHSNRGVLANQFLYHWVYGGVALVVCAGMTTIDTTVMAEDFSFRTISRLGVSPLLLSALLVYLLVGMWLYSQTRWQVLRMRWLINGATVQTGLEQRWNRSVVWLMAGIAFAAAFLPIGSTFGIARILQFLIFLLAGLVRLFLYLIALLLAIPVALLGPAEELANEPLPTLEPMAPPEIFLPPPEAAGPNLVANGLFWAVLLVLVVVGVLFFLRERGITVPWDWARAGWQALLAWWRSLRGRVTELVQVLQRGRESATPASPDTPWRFFRLSALSPREQIRFFYLAAVRRAGEKGVPRQLDETPLEFAQDLKESWPEAEQDIDSLTDAFLQARYSPQPIRKEDVNPVKKTWNQVKTSLRRKTN